MVSAAGCTSGTGGRVMPYCVRHWATSATPSAAQISANCLLAASMVDWPEASPASELADADIVELDGSAQLVLRRGDRISGVGVGRLVGRAGLCGLFGCRLFGGLLGCRLLCGLLSRRLFGGLFGRRLLGRLLGWRLFGGLFSRGLLGRGLGQRGRGPGRCRT